MNTTTMHDEEGLFLVNGMRHVIASPDIDKTVRDLVRIAAEAVGSNMGALYLVHKNRCVLRPAVVVNLPDEYVKGVGDVPVGEQCCGRAVFHNAPWYVEDIWTNPLFSAATREGAKRAGVRAGFSVPVTKGDGNCIGSLSAHFPERHLPSEFEIERHLLFAKLIGFALSRMADAANGAKPPRSARAIDHIECGTAASD